MGGDGQEIATVENEAENASNPARGSFRDDQDEYCTATLVLSSSEHVLVRAALPTSSDNDQGWLGGWAGQVCDKQQQMATSEVVKVVLP
eukprot:CAMPEP_0202827798 /NCGR_PEP_ID=MMETSP1389-20130828/14526_1 /ASSEMBLY_ACC=CAM_ASM_000865 /TAXON_ID=302021 /ORGANISM="Rhodomonas sp., Strain CCMP768" /LENGTH=88 /DNA_ID=CAMNT_0049501243 /DNA_START=376 /DNA_END=641 /DNA_ORIENTATION=-